ncbi:MAG: aminomethyl-transferring glycine dehydrogenase subunit GcvPA [Gammaproteobacteria bacterium]|nr:aminomethyl-transferring glycine dehydrogenase subunit GcvPA [Gammaproteobacteria bacterium]
MPFIPHTQLEVDAMLDCIGIDAMTALFDEVPTALYRRQPMTLPPALSEMAVSRLMQERAAIDVSALNGSGQTLNFVGAGAYDHHIPAAVWQLASRGEFYSAYTPYQAEASQGLLQVLFEYQSMMVELTGMEVSNASLYDGATALAEAVLMAVRIHKAKRTRVLIPANVHPHYRHVVDSITRHQGINIDAVPFDAQGHVDVSQLETLTSPEEVAALVIQQPNFFGSIEEIEALMTWAQQHDVLVIAVVNPMAMAYLQPPGAWGERGADIVCGEGQPLGIPMSGGGPYFGFMATRAEYVRQLPGRIVGMSTDSAGDDVYSLTLQAREQHIRRSRATSNICTNQGLMVVAATVYMSLLGSEGLEKVAQACFSNTQYLRRCLTDCCGIESRFSGAHFHEVVMRFGDRAVTVLNHLRAHGIHGGYLLDADYSEMAGDILMCATEKHTKADIDRMVDAVKKII